MITMEKQVHARHIVKWAADKPDVVVFSGDLTASTEITEFSETYPQRFYLMGMAEQNMLSWAGGMAREGFVPLVHTFAVFLTRRPYDQVAMSIAYPNLNVKLVGFLPGMMTPGGVTHQAIDDINLMRGLPNVTVLECGDAADVESVLDVAYSINGPVYIRQLRGIIPRLFDTPMELSKARQVSQGDAALVLSSGVMTQEVIRASAVLAKHGINIKHLHISTLKPFDDPEVDKALLDAKCPIFTVENHYVIGGLGSCVAERMAELGASSKLHKIAIPGFAHGANMPYLLAEFNMDAKAIAERIAKAVGVPVSVVSEEIPEIGSLDPSSKDGDQLEAL